MEPPANKPPNPDDLSSWLSWIEQLHPRHIELGLDRVQRIQQRLNLDALTFPIITIAGTNGKGSTVAFLQSMLTAAGYRVGSYTSPHIHRYNERIVIADQAVADVDLCNAFATVNKVRQGTTLTYFEFGTLAAMQCFVDADVDIALLEVGMGGRLDAVNVWDADVAMVISIGIDHVDWLGADRESIGREKAGIFRQGRPAICADPEPPRSIADVAKEQGAGLYQYGQQYMLSRTATDWRYQGPEQSYSQLPYPLLMGEHQCRNAAAAILALSLLPTSIMTKQQHIHDGIVLAHIPGRFQIVSTEPCCVVDIAHNADATKALAAILQNQPCAGCTHALVAMLENKDHAAVLTPMLNVVDHWHVAELVNTHMPSATADQLRRVLTDLDARIRPTAHGSVEMAFKAIQKTAAADDRIVVFGSFYTVGVILHQGH